ncbi:small nuclear ribonucleoprotein Sm D2 [Thecamonas trahens ATCC 50062]|uniref:Small nuclear ribonucleoprotein Sm D2 n=1 Tax=Thecamonas trahens ATCC 50062 TaxID=461836 RepID=A0A0L0DDC2_THETB|nr:small nuclear ribonucleoprotein Sm D2 [Thecamonas trahens ATCC 50062]KNC49328.1 small nuclear ribonucleoprotein Sm D2 [Thecamonas trahens ATCC 50062]|eukprot:XP_013758036.1 small nuclear ribonucleoprotein Sm D2 [Thecamonas trahens ATCC 50062]
MELEQPEVPKEGEGVAGPLSMLADAVKNSTQVLIALRNNRKLLARVRAFDRHFNMVLENVSVFWTEKGGKGRGVKRAEDVEKDMFVSKMFLRGAGVVLVLKNPK